MSHDCMAKTIFPGFQWKIQNIQYLKRRTSLYIIIIVNFFQVNGRSLEQILWKKNVEWKLSLWDMISSQSLYSLDFSEKFKIYSILKIITSLYKIILVNYFQVNERSLVYILWKTICGMEIKWVMIASQRQYSMDFTEKFNIYSILKRITSIYKIILVTYFR